jgi:DNA-binding transcriptional MerR regulator
MEWLDYTQTAEKLNVPESTIRRYGKQFERFIEYREYNRKRRLSPDSVALLARIKELLDNDFTVLEVRNLLTQERDGNMKPEEVATAHEVDTTTTELNAIKAIHALVIRQYEAEQVARVELQAKVEQLTNTVEQMAEELKRIREEQKKPWYKRLF